MLFMGLSVQSVLDLVVAGNFFDDWFWHFCFHCFHSMLDRFLAQRQGHFLIHMWRSIFFANDCHFICGNNGEQKHGTGSTFFLAVCDE
ncbi:hypothetical protein Pint_23412 [Pistacia integerrima]|uniref:Uncharacterized protein n=1 Tax=Pistacia integerrima TaxID=434235 RepID=A0ACC0YNK3_9ROSI|nr:hypothetical protein Pint_23412 [Pistacia integerrima]